VFTDASQPPVGDNITAWYWEFGDNGTPSTERSPRYRYARAGTYKVRLTVTSANRCTNTSEQTVTAGGLSLRIMPDTSVCAGVPTAFSAQVGTNEQVTWQWDFGSLGRFSTAQPTVTVPANQSSLSVTVTATTASGCSATLTRTLPVRQSPEAQFVYEASSGNPLSVTFNNRSVNGSRYVWDFGESGATSSATNPTHTYAQPGLYEVSLRAVQANGCTSVATQTVLIGVAGSDRLAVLPNPHTAEQSADVRLVFRLARQQAVLLEIHDLTGRRLTQTTLQNTREGVNTVQLPDVLQASLAKGLYVIVMRADNVRQVCKMVAQ
jgi:PKD repeat protein